MKRYLTVNHQDKRTFGRSTTIELAHISLKLSAMPSTSISPVMFSWLLKCRRRVSSRNARFASVVFANIRVTILIATVSPEISSAAELAIIGS